jgi:hypothetical protein
VFGPRPGALGFGGPCAATGKAMTNIAKNKSDVAKRSEFEKRRIVDDLADLQSTPRSGVELLEKRREASTKSTPGVHCSPFGSLEKSRRTEGAILL